ncbi:unnamed protein product [Thlaspi arvense]|uniref:Cyclin-dependent kinase inhibitor n=1 Tax=Thlaspi arvense TaxID=13288 RepID=A0AAU9RWA6_THLAR|nr:unnamed protein product [Thlaspi arvense]
MGKYIKKPKIAGDVSLNDISHSTTLASRTRAAAKNLALQRLRSHPISPSGDADSFGYLQLRSRRLLKLPLLGDTRKQLTQRETTNPRAKSEKSDSETTGLAKETEEDCGDNENQSGFDCNFVEKGLDFESGDRDSTPCDLRRDSNVPSSLEIEDFFAYAEQQQQRFFIEKYNFDIVSENPMPGRYEWVKVMP